MSDIQINLIDAFTSWDMCRDMYVKLMEALKDAGPEATVLALQALFRIESEVKSDQFPEDVHDESSRYSAKMALLVAAKRCIFRRKELDT